MHLAGGYLDIVKCKKILTEVRKSFQNKLQQAREDTIKKKTRVEEEYYKAMREPIYDKYEGRSNEVDVDLTVGIGALVYIRQSNEASTT